MIVRVAGGVDHTEVVADDNTIADEIYGLPAGGTEAFRPRPAAAFWPFSREVAIIARSSSVRTLSKSASRFAQGKNIPS